MDAGAYMELEVDVDGEEVFIVDAGVLSSFSGRIKRLQSKSKGVTYSQKVILHDFPGGAASFELITRFCYNKGKVNINPYNLCYLACASCYMEMNKYVTGTENLCERIGKSLEEIKYWTWSELIVALKQCQELLPAASSLGILNRCMDCLLLRVASSCETSQCPSTSSPESFGYRFSCDTRSTDGLKNKIFRESWWFEDIVVFDTCLIEFLVKSMVFRNFDHGIVGRFLIYYQKSRFSSASVDDKAKIIETIVEMLNSLDINSVSSKSLFGILRVSVSTSISRICRTKLENMIGSRLDEVTLDNLLFPSPNRRSYHYDVNLVLRLLKSFLSRGVCCLPFSRLEKVARLLDSYLSEIAPDPNLKPSKFLSLIKAIPGSARESCDEVYQAVNLYLEAHSGLSEDQKIEICTALDYERLSSNAIRHLAQNNKFPSKSVVQALILQRHKLKGLLQNTRQFTCTEGYPSAYSENPCNGENDEWSQHLVLFSKKLDFSDENKKMRSHLQGMQWRVMELEKDCRMMQDQMAKMVKSRSSNYKTRSIPKLC